MFYANLAPATRPQTPRSKHGHIRGQQRSVPQSLIDALVDFGDTQHDGAGALRYSFSKRSWRAYAAYLGTEAKYFERYRSAYIVVGFDGTLITVGWRH